MKVIEKQIKRPLLSGRELTLIILIVFIGMFASIAKKSAFLSVNNLQAILTSLAFDLLIAVGMTLILILGGIDLSVGAVVAFVSVNTALLLQQGKPVFLALIVGLSLALLIGTINGILIVKAHIPPFIMTLGSMTLLRGVSYVQTSGYYVNKLPEEFIKIGRGDTLNIPNIILISFGVLLLVALLIKKSKYLYQYYFIGSSAGAAFLSGIPSGILTVMGFALCSFFAGLSGILMSSRMAMGYAGFGLGAETRAIAAVVIGGASMHGGDGSVLGTALGVILIALINNVFIMFNGSANWQTAISGIVLILALILDLTRKKLKEAELHTKRSLS